MVKVIKIPIRPKIIGLLALGIFSLAASCCALGQFQIWSFFGEGSQCYQLFEDEADESQEVLPTQIENPSPEPTASPSASPSPTSLATPSATPAAVPKTRVASAAADCPAPLSNRSQLMTALSAHFGESESGFIVDQQTQTHAQGQVGNKWWLAAKSKADQWQVVTSGVSYVDCADIRGYDFPREMVPACWDYGNNKYVNR